MNQAVACSSLRELLPGQVDIWYVYQNRVDIASLVDAYWQIITPEERNDVQRFRFDHLRVEALVARTLQRWVLSQYAPVKPSEWRFGKGPYGKPFVEAPVATCPSFNLSHSGGMIVCAVSWAASVGVDVEDVTRDLAIPDLARRFFAPPEADDVTRQPATMMRDRFYRYWTLKEAYVKATGLGISQPFDSFAFELQRGLPPMISFRDGGTPDAWRFAEISFPGRYHVSIAVDLRAHEFCAIAREVVPFSEIAPTTLECCCSNQWFAVSR
jgi:4'-phosphopantetheinyl transferase